MYTVTEQVGENLYKVLDSKDNVTEVVSSDIILTLVQRGVKIKGVTEDGVIFPYNTDRAPYAGTVEDLKYKYVGLLQRSPKGAYFLFYIDGKELKHYMSDTFTLLAWDNDAFYAIKHNTILGTYKILGKIAPCGDSSNIYESMLIPMDRIAYSNPLGVLKFIESHSKDVEQYGERTETNLRYYRRAFYIYNTEYKLWLPVACGYNSKDEKPTRIDESSAWINPQFIGDMPFRHSCRNPVRGTQEDINKAVKLARLTHSYVITTENSDTFSSSLEDYCNINALKTTYTRDLNIPISIRINNKGIFVRARKARGTTGDFYEEYTLEELYENYKANGESSFLNASFFSVRENIVKISTLTQIYTFNMDYVYAVYKKLLTLNKSLTKQIVTRRLLQGDFELNIYGNGDLNLIKTTSNKVDIPKEVKTIKTHSVNIVIDKNDIRINIPDTVEKVEVDPFNIAYKSSYVQDDSNKYPEFAGTELENAYSFTLNLANKGVENIKNLVFSLFNKIPHKSRIHITCTNSNVEDVILFYFFYVDNCVRYANKYGLNLSNISYNSEYHRGYISDIPLNFLLQPDVAKPIVEKIMKVTKNFGRLDEYSKIKLTKALQDHTFVNLSEIRYLASYDTILGNLRRFLEIIQQEHLGGAYQIYFNLQYDLINQKLKDLESCIKADYCIYLNYPG